MTTRLDDLTREIATRPVAYILTASPDGELHSAQISASGPSAEESPTVTITRLGRTSLRNIADGSRISLMWPPSEPEGYTLIVNGDADPAASGLGATGALDLTIGRAVLHRPGEVPPGSTVCGSDCIPLVG